MPTIYNKVEIDGDTLIDLSTDTVTSAEHIVAGYVGHLANGTVVTGIATGGSGYTRTVIVPQQTITPTSYSNPSTGGTYYHAPLTHLDGLEVGADYIITYNNNEYDSTCVIMYSTNYVLGSIHYFFGSSGTYPFGIIWDNNSDEFEFAIDSASQVTIKIEKLNLLNSGTLLSNKSITANGTYNASTDNLDGYSSVTVNVPATAPNLQSKTATPTESIQTITADSAYDGLSSVEIGAISSNYIGSGVTRISNNSGIIINGATVTVTGQAYWTGNVSKTIPLQSKTVTPTESTQTITADSNYSGLSSVEIGAISSTYVGSGITQRDSDDLTASGATVTVPAGYYEENASKSVASGTAGTPTASKGTVSNHSISITPSVTNTTGYITGGTKNGTAVTVTASELASGNKAITANGTNIDVVGYSTVSVAVPGESPNLQGKTGINPTTSSQTITADSGYDGLSSVQINAMPSGSATTPATTITANPSISVNSSGLITATASASQSITPTVSAGYVSTGTTGTVTVSGSNTQQLTALGATTYNTSTTDQTITSGRYITGTQTIKAVTVSGLDASKILSGTTVMIGDANDADRIASVTGSVTFSTITTSSSNPSGGSNGDIWIKTS